VAPNLSDKIWLYSRSEAEIINGITNGRTNRMPAWGEFLGEAKVHLLTAYVYGLGGGVKSAPAAAPAAADAPVAPATPAAAASGQKN
jgi:cytochrome c oxidase cbb3-type subunit 3